MSFENAQRHFEDLLRRKTAGTIDEKQFAVEVAKIRVKDDVGYTWCIDPQRGWLYWNGSDWVARVQEPATENAEELKQKANDSDRTSPHRSDPHRPSHDQRDPRHVAGQSLRWLRMGANALQGRLPPPQVFLQQAKKVPIKKRQQSWWDALAIMGGAVGGFLWFLYSSVRGMPHFAPFGLQHESFFDFLPPMAMAAAAVMLFLFRRKLAQLLAPFRKIPLAGRFGMGGILLVFGLLIRYKSGLFASREGLDVITPLLMLMLPICIVFFRKPLDMMLLPLDPIRSKIPRVVLVVVGLAIPFLVSHILYSWFNMMMYPFLRASVVIGTMVSYAILRTPAKPSHGDRKAAPVAASAQPPEEQSSRNREHLQRRMAWTGLIWIAIFHVFCISPVFADDFFRDPFNGNDGLRTDGVATAIAGTVTVIVSGLVNGAEVVRTVLEGAAGGEGTGAAGGAGAGTGDEGEEKKPKEIQIQVNTVDQNGAGGTRLERGINDAVFIYASCFEVGKGPLPEMDDSIVFNLSAGAPFVFLNDHGRAHGQRCASVQLEDPFPDELPPSAAGVTVSAAFDGSRISVPVSLELVVAAYRIRFR